MAQNPYYTPRAVAPRQRIGAKRDQFGNIGPGARAATPPSGLTTGSLSTGSNASTAPSVTNAGGGAGGGHDWTAFDNFGKMNETVRAKYGAPANGQRIAPPPIAATPQVTTPMGDTVRMGANGTSSIEYDPTKNAHLQRTVTNGTGGADVAMQIDPRYGGGTAKATGVHGIQAATGGQVMADGNGGTRTLVTDPYARYTAPGMKDREITQLKGDLATVGTDPEAAERMKRREFLAQKFPPGATSAAPAASPAATPAPVSAVDPNTVARTKQDMLGLGLLSGTAAPIMGAGGYTDQEVGAFGRPASAPQPAAPVSAPAAQPVRPEPVVFNDPGVDLIPMSGASKVYFHKPDLRAGSTGISEYTPSFDMSRSPVADAYRRTRPIAAR